MTKTTLASEQIHAARILVVGDMMLDRYWFGDVERISPEAPVPVVQIKRSTPAMSAAICTAIRTSTPPSSCACWHASSS